MGLIIYEKQFTCTRWQLLLLRLALSFVRAAVFVIAVGSSLVSCTPSARQIQAQTANALAVSANASLPVVVEQFRQDSLRAIDQSKTEPEARQKLAAIDARYEPIWKAWEALRLAQDGWATVLENGLDTLAAFLSLKGAYCGLLSLWPKEIPAIPLAPIVCPKGQP
jgi:hypothetical protein